MIDIKELDVFKLSELKNILTELRNSCKSNFDKNNSLSSSPITEYDELTKEYCSKYTIFQHKIEFLNKLIEDKINHEFKFD